MLKLWIALTSLVNDRVNRLHNDKGATAVEYGLMVALIAVAIIVMVGFLGGALNDKFKDVCGAVKGSAC